MFDPENMGVAVGILFLAGLEADIPLSSAGASGGAWPPGNNLAPPAEGPAIYIICVM